VHRETAPRVDDLRLAFHKLATNFVHAVLAIEHGECRVLLQRPSSMNRVAANTPEKEAINSPDINVLSSHLPQQAMDQAEDNEVYKIDVLELLAEMRTKVADLET
jgi:hypothetical protein